MENYFIIKQDVAKLIDAEIEILLNTPGEEATAASFFPYQLENNRFPAGTLHAFNKPPFLLNKGF